MDMGIFNQAARSLPFLSLQVIITKLLAAIGFAIIVRSLTTADIGAIGLIIYALAAQASGAVGAAQANVVLYLVASTFNIIYVTRHLKVYENLLYKGELV